MAERAPAQQSPLAKDGTSLDTRQVDCSQGVMSNIDDYLRPATKAKRIRNFHQFSRGVFSSGGGGWRRDLQVGLNGGTEDTLDFGEYRDALGAEYLMVQVGNTLYNYALGGTVTIAGTRTTGDIIYISFQLVSGDYVFTHTVNTGTDTSNNVMTSNIRAEINLNAILIAAGVTATNVNNVMTLVLAKYIADPTVRSSNATDVTAGTETLVFQHIGVGTAITGMTALSATLLPCMRLSSPNGTTTTPFTIYCNGGAEPKKLSNATPGTGVNTVATLGFSSGRFTTAIEISGFVNDGASASQRAVTTLAIFSPQLNVTPVTVTYLTQINDTVIQVAAGLAVAINTNVDLLSAGFLATANGNTITVNYPTTVTAIFAQWPAARTAEVNGANAAGNTVTLTINGTAITYTQVAGDTFITTAAKLASKVNASSTLINQGIFAVARGPFATVMWPREITIPTIVESVTGTVTLSGDAATVQSAVMTGVPDPGTRTITFTSGSITGSPETATFTQVATDTVNTVTTGMAAAINAMASLTNEGIYASAFGNVLIITYPSDITITFTTGGTGNGAFILPTNDTYPTLVATVETFTTGSTTQVWPGVFGDGLVYTKPALCAPFGSRMAYTRFANDGSSGNAIVQQLLISSQGNAEKFAFSAPSLATDAFSIPIPLICGRPTAMRSFKTNTNTSSEQLVIGCTNGMCVITGTNVSNFKLEIQSLEFGIPSNRCFVELNNTLLYMANDGFRIFSGENSNTNLLTDSISLDIYDEFKKIDKLQMAKAHCIHHRDTQEVWFWVPYYGTAGLCKNAFIFQYNTLDGQPIWYFKDNTVSTASIEFNSTFYGGNDVGLIQKWYSVNNYDDSAAGGSAQNILPGNEIVFALIGVGNPAQYCSINQVLISTSANDQKFLMNASAYEMMDNGSTRKQQMQPINFVVQSTTIPQTVLAPASPAQWTINFSAFPQDNSKFLSDYGPVGHGRFWEFSINCADSSHNCDVTGLQATISIGGKRV